MKDKGFKEYFSSYPLKFVKKGESLLRSGEYSHEFYYVEQGCLRSYILDIKGKEHIFQFAPEDWLISDEEALNSHTKAIFNIDAVEDSMIRVATPTSQNLMYGPSDEHIHSVVDKLNRKAVSLRNRIILLLSATAEERYDDFLKTYSNLAQRLPLKMIASYLGIVPESLSRIRKERVTKKS
jgi:CRP-like cAMP-binding protein